MDRFEFKKMMDQLFKEFEIEDKYETIPNERYINKNITIGFSPRRRDYYLTDVSIGRLIYESPQYQSLEQCFDEIIIFKELIFPKYQ